MQKSLIMVNMNLVPDPLVKDDQAIVVNVRNEGLVNHYPNQ